MEACAYAFSLARYLKRQTGCAAHALNPGKLAMTGKPARKTDREDARFIQRYPEEELLLAKVPTAEEGGRLRTKFHGLNERMGKTKSAVAAARRLVCLL
jgi:hypothetical protein